MDKNIVDEAIGSFCKAMQDEIKELPFLSPLQKQEASNWLNDCASSSSSSSDRLGSFNANLKEVQTKLRNISGVSLPKDELSTGSLNAFAFSGGNYVVFGMSPQQQKQLAHELTHTVQQSRS